MFSPVMKKENKPVNCEEKQKNDQYRKNPPDKPGYPT
jgi:hypothetical protein